MSIRGYSRSTDSEPELHRIGCLIYLAGRRGDARLFDSRVAASRVRGQSKAPVFLSIDLVRPQAMRAGQEIRLSPKQFELLRHLVAHAGKVLTHCYLLR